MKRKKVGRVLGGIAAVGVLGSVAAVLPAEAAGPGTGKSNSTSVDPYLLPSASGVYVESLLTVNDPSKTAYNGYKMVGIPDGLGAFARPGDGRVVVSMNHELGNTAGIPRADTGLKGSFMSRYVVDQVDHAVRFGEDLNTVVYYWDPATSTYSTTPGAGQSPTFSRFCSGSLANPGQFYNPVSGNGTSEAIHLAGEETGSEGRAVGVQTNGVTRELPRLGKFSFENAVPAFNTTDRTVVVSSDDSNPGRLGVYLGTKKTGGGTFYNAGLTNGVLTNVKLTDVAVQTDAEFRTKYNKGDNVRFGLTDIDWTQTGANQKIEAETKGAFLGNRIEDGAFDPLHKNDFYFVTTDGGEGSGDGGGGGLWRLRFDDIENPRSGGTLTLLLDGSESPTFNKPDNITVDTLGNVLIQEDPGNVNTIASIYAYRISDGARGRVAQFDPALFDPASPSFLTKDEESSGIIDAKTLLGPGWYLFDAQVHTNAGLPAGTGAGTVQEFVERGQLLALRVTNWTAVYGS